MGMEPPRKRPTSVTVIGWLFLVGALFGILSASMGLLAFLAMQQIGGLPTEFPQEIPQSMRWLFGMFRHFGLFAALQLSAGAFVLVASLQFLRLRAWARTALEVVAWLTLLSNVGFGLLWLLVWRSVTSAMPLEETTQIPPGFAMMGTTIGIGVIAVWAIPLVVILVFLRRPALRAVFK